MPPKKEADGKKKKVAAPGSGGELSPEDQIKLLKLTIDSLQVQLADRSEETSKAVHAKEEVIEKLDELSKTLEDAEQSKLDLLQSMTRQIDELEVEFSMKLNNKDIEITKINEKSLHRENELKEELNQRDSLISKCEVEIEKLHDELSTQRKEFNNSLQVIIRITVFRHTCTVDYHFTLLNYHYCL